MQNKSKKTYGQSSLEYAVIIACIVGALVSMQVYIKRGIQGKLRSAADDIGRQYDPGNTTGDITISVKSDITTEVKSTEDNGKLRTTTTVSYNNQTEQRDGDETVGDLGSSLF